MLRPLIPHFTQVPDVILDFWMASLTGAEFKVLMYVVRRTYGFQNKQDGDHISLRQLVEGITTVDKQAEDEARKKAIERGIDFDNMPREKIRKVLDLGTGLNKETVTKALQSLHEKGIVVKKRNDSDEHGHMANHYSLNLDAELPTPKKTTEGGGGGPLSEKPTSSPKNPSTPLVGKTDKLGGKSRHALVGPSDPPLSENPTHNIQKKQETEEQETATSSGSPMKAGKPAVVALSSSTDPVEQAEALLRAAGFTVAVSKSLAHHGAEVVRRQIEALPLRKVGKNRLGMLRKSIEEGWDVPKSPQEEREEVRRGNQRDAQELQQARERAKVEQARETLGMLQTNAPEAFTAFLAFVEDRKLKALSGTIAKKSDSFRKALEDAFDAEAKRIELLPEFLLSHPVGRSLPAAEFRAA